MATTSQHGTLTANVVTTVTLTGNKRWLRIQHRGAGMADVWWTWGYDSAVTPATDGSADGSYNLAGGGIDLVEEPISRDNEAQIVVKLISTDAVPYSVEAG